MPVLPNGAWQKRGYLWLFLKNFSVIIFFWLHLRLVRGTDPEDSDPSDHSKNSWRSVWWQRWNAQFAFRYRMCTGHCDMLRIRRRAVSSSPSLWSWRSSWCTMPWESATRPVSRRRCWMIWWRSSRIWAAARFPSWQAEGIRGTYSSAGTHGCAVRYFLRRDHLYLCDLIRDNVWWIFLIGNAFDKYRIMVEVTFTWFS